MSSIFAKEKYFNGYSDNRSVQENFNLITAFMQDSANTHITSTTSRLVSSVQWMTPEIRRKIRRKNATHAKAKKTGSSKEEKSKLILGSITNCMLISGLAM